MTYIITSSKKIVRILECLANGFKKKCLKDYVLTDERFTVLKRNATSFGRYIVTFSKPVSADVYLIDDKLKKVYPALMIDSYEEVSYSLPVIIYDTETGAYVEQHKMAGSNYQINTYLKGRLRCEIEQKEN